MRRSHQNVPFQAPRVIAALILREMTTSFGRSSLGYLWALLEPIGVIIVFTLAFSLVFKEPPLGDSFPLFYATGYLPFGMYNACQSKISTSLTQNKALLFYPAVTYTDVILGRFTLIALTELTAAFCIFGGLMIYIGTTMVGDFRLVLAALGLALTFGMSIGICNATLFEVFPAWRSIWRVLSRPMFFVSAIFYLFDSLPANLQAVLWWNPLIHIVGTLRAGFYPEYDAPYVSWLYVVSLSLSLMAIGLIILRTSSKFIINN